MFLINRREVCVWKGLQYGTWQLTDALMILFPTHKGEEMISQADRLV